MTHHAPSNNFYEILEKELRLVIKYIQMAKQFDDDKLELKNIIDILADIKRKCLLEYTLKRHV